MASGLFSKHRNINSFMLIANKPLRSGALLPLNYAHARTIYWYSSTQRAVSEYMLSTPEHAHQTLPATRHRYSIPKQAQTSYSRTSKVRCRQQRQSRQSDMRGIVTSTAVVRSSAAPDSKDERYPAEFGLRVSARTLNAALNGSTRQVYACHEGGVRAG